MYHDKGLTNCQASEQLPEEVRIFLKGILDAGGSDTGGK
jgi:hypothetical protein